MSLAAGSINGPFVVGYTLCFVLTGALLVQAYIYFTRFADDRKAMKILVIAILILETAMTAITFAGLWISAVGAPAGLIEGTDGIAVRLLVTPTSLLMALAPVTGLVTTLTHSFYCWRISSLRKSRLIPAPIVMLSLLQLASIIRFAFSDGLFPSNVSFDSQIVYQLSPWLVTWLGSSAICDLAITTCMIFSFRTSKSHFESSKSTLIKLTRLTIETGLVTTLAALLELILGIVFKEYYYHIAVFFMISKLYANCLLATLNFRVVFRNPSDRNLTAIVWDDSSYSQPERPLCRLPYAVQNMGQVESDVDMTAHKFCQRSDE